MGSLQFPNMGMGLRLAAFGRRSSAIKILYVYTIYLERQTTRNTVEFVINLSIFIYPEVI